ncbi:hypothetical protein [Actinophytocola sp.]|uniref:hypothetical protein n=1 Tax=Actinophytocola sp. TaxID=1872138 RepID=UPI002ED7A6F5
MKKRLPWVLVAVVVLVAAVAVTLLVRGNPGSGNDEPASSPPSGAARYDLSTPERAAKSFARAAAAGNGKELLALTCLDHPKCVAQQGSLVNEQVDEAKQLILGGMAGLATQFEGAEFGKATEASVPGARQVPYRTPDMPAGERRALMFVRFEGRWLYVGSAGASAPAT